MHPKNRTLSIRIYDSKEIKVLDQVIDAISETKFESGKKCKRSK